MKIIGLTFLLLLLLLSTHAPVAAQTKSRTSSSRKGAAEVIESGKFRVYELNQVQGEESYEISRGPRGLTVKARTDLPFQGEEQKPSLTAILQTKDDLTPLSFQIKGIRPLEIAIDTSVTVQGRIATVREGKSVRRAPLPESFFTFGGYVPVTMEMMLVRYWLTHQGKDSIKLLPGGEAFIEARGKDIVTIAGKSAKLDRYHLSGSKWGGGWGRQTLWFDSENRLVAAVNLATNVETNFSAIRDGYESSLSFFLKRTIEDGLDRLTQIANRLSPKSIESLALLGATLIDVTGKPQITDSAVVIQGDRIIAAGPRSQIKIPERATIVDVSGKYLLPGLWDMHAHLYQAELGPAYLAAGITTARDVGNDLEFATTMRDAANQGRGLGPRLLLAGYIDGKNDGHSFDVQVDTPAAARAAVQRYKDAGYEQIKIRDHVKLEILKVITAEAHRLGMTVTGHVPKGLNALAAVEAGMDEISHLNFVAPVLEPKAEGSESNLSNELDSPRARQSLKLLRERGTVIDPTMATLELAIRPTNVAIETFEPGMARVAPELFEQINKKGAPPETASQMRTALEYLLLIIRALHREGIPIIAGTDVSVPAHSLHRELELYVKAGLTPLEAIQAATITPARVMKLENEVGTIEAGKRADILILDANPLDNISNIRRVRFVVTQGRLFESAKLWETVGFKP
jgi:imidazolonepropionase-like amidohydrolase